MHLDNSAFTVTNDSLVMKSDRKITFNQSQFLLLDNGSAAVCSVFSSSYRQNVSSFVVMKGK